MLIGYARLSTTDETIDLQRDALIAAGCERVFTDERISRALSERSGIELERVLEAVQEGDTLVVWKIYRLGRSLAHIVGLIADLGGRGVGFRSVSDPIDTQSAGGRLVFHIMGALAEFERSLIAQRTREGLVAAKRRGQKLGRRASLTADQVAHARWFIEGGESQRAVATSFGVARSTLYASLKAPSGP